MRLAGCFKKGMMEQTDLKVALASFLGTTKGEIIELALSQEVIHMTQASTCLQEGDRMVNVQHFVEHNYQKQDGDPPLEHMDWDVLLLKRLKEALRCDTEVGCHAQRDSHHRPWSHRWFQGNWKDKAWGKGSLTRTALILLDFILQCSGVVVKLRIVKRLEGKSHAQSIWKCQNTFDLILVRTWSDDPSSYLSMPTLSWNRTHFHLFLRAGCWDMPKTLAFELKKTQNHFSHKNGPDLSLKT